MIAADHPPPPPSVGFIGVGAIAGATVAGLRSRWPDLPIHLSPRSEATTRALAAADPRIMRHPDNAAVVAASAIVFLCMLPPQLDAAVMGLPFRSGQIVASCVAGTPLADVARLVAPATACRLVPLPSIAHREGPLLMMGAPLALRTLLAPLGDIIETEDEAAFRACASGSALMSTFLALHTASATELERQGASRDDAVAYVGSLLAALAATARRTPPAEFAALAGRHETPGGLNERVRQSLEQQGWFAALGPALAGVAALGRDELA